MAASLAGQLVVAISSRALFDFEEENEHFEANDDRAYMQLQLERIDQAAKPGVAFSLVQKLLAFNDPATQRVEVAREVPRLAYTPTQAAQALGISRSSLYRLLPYLETIELPWGGTLIPVDVLEWVTAERRRAAVTRRPRRRTGRRPAVPPAVVDRIRVARRAGKSLRAIAAELDTDRVPTAHGGVRWWPSTVRGVLERAT